MAVELDFEQCELEWYEVWNIADIMKARVVRNLKRKRQDRWGQTNGFGFDEMFCGCLGEGALAKHKRLWYSGAIDDFTADDAGPYQVRACDETYKKMLMHDADKNDRPYVNALCLRDRLPLIIFRGWLWGRECKNRDYWHVNIPKPAYLVPVSALRPMRELPSLDELQNQASSRPVAAE